MQPDKVFAWAATLWCVLVCANCALVFAKNNPRVFTILALLATAWAVLLPYYGGNTTTDLIPAFNGFLLAYVGILLSREADDRTRALHGQPRQLEVQTSDKLTVCLLVIVVAPSVVSLTDVILGKGMASKAVDITEAIVASLLTVLGYWLLWVGASEFRISVNNAISGMWTHGLAVLLVLYSGLEIAYCAWFVKLEIYPLAITPISESNYWHTHSAPPMTVFMRVAFGVAKLLLTYWLLFVILWSDIPPEGRTSQKALELIWESIPKRLAI